MKTRIVSSRKVTENKNTSFLATDYIGRSQVEIEQDIEAEERKMRRVQSRIKRLREEKEDERTSN